MGNTHVEFIAGDPQPARWQREMAERSEVYATLRSRPGEWGKTDLGSFGVIPSWRVELDGADDIESHRSEDGTVWLRARPPAPTHRRWWQR